MMISYAAGGCGGKTHSNLRRSRFNECNDLALGVNVEKKWEIGLLHKRHTPVWVSAAGEWGIGDGGIWRIGELDGPRITIYG
jgi:hypothetical protein